MGGFAQEVREARKASVATPQEAAPESTPQAVAVETPAQEAPAAEVGQDGPELHFLPVGAEPVEPEAKEAEAVREALKPKTPDVTDQKPKIKIGGKEFGSMEEAIRYAEELELAKLQDDAFKEGFEAAKPPVTEAPTAPVKTIEEQVEELLFENPKEALKLYREEITKSIFNEYNKLVTTEKTEQQRQAQQADTWNKFYTDHPELSESKDYVDFVMKKNWDTLSVKPVTAALAEIAEMARSGLKITKEAALPKRELQSRPAVMPGASSSSTAAQPAATEEPKMDFIAQVNKLRKRK